MNTFHRIGRRAALATLLASVAAGVPLLASAQAYPTKPVRIVVG